MPIIQNFKRIKTPLVEVCWLALKTPFKTLLQQGTRESKRRASKEATAVSKEGSEEPEPVNVCDER